MSLCIFRLSVEPSAVLKLLEQYGCPNAGALKNDFSLPSFSLHYDNHFKLAFKRMFWSLMMHVISRLFNKFLFICIQPAPLQQL